MSGLLRFDGLARGGDGLLPELRALIERQARLQADPKVAVLAPACSSGAASGSTRSPLDRGGGAPRQWRTRPSRPG